MRYLIIPKNSEPYLSEYYDFENYYTEGMIVIYLTSMIITMDGVSWRNINKDHL